MSDNTTSGSLPSPAAAANAGAPAAPAADWGADAGTNRGSGLARGKRVTPPAASAPASNPAAIGTYQPSAVQVLKADSEYQNPFASADVAPSTPASVVAPVPVAVTPVAQLVASKSAEAPAPAAVAPVASAVIPPAAAAKAELNILPPADVKRPAQSWESTPAFPYEGKPAGASTGSAAKPALPLSESPLEAERPVFRPVRRSEVPMLERAPDASGKALPREDFHGGGQRQGRGGQGRGGQGRGGQGRGGQGRGGQGQGNRAQSRDGGPRQPRDERGPIAPGTPVGGSAPTAGAHSQPASGKKPSGLFGWVKGLFGTAPEPGKPSSPGSQASQAQPGEGGPDANRRRRRRGGRGRSGGGAPQSGPSGPQGASPTQQGHGQGHPAHGHGGGEHRPQGQGGGRRRGGRGRGRSGGGGQAGPGGPSAPGGHRHEGGGSGIPPSA